MQNARSTDPRLDHRNETCRSVIANIATPIEHLNASSKVLELAIARETADDRLDMHEDILVLDDITPCYLSANAALIACNAGLAVALHALLDARSEKSRKHGVSRTDRCASGSVISS